MIPYPPVSGGLIKTFSTLNALSKEYEIYAVFITDVHPSQHSVQRLESMGIHVKYFVSKQIRASLKEKFWEVIACYLHGVPFYVYQYTYKPMFGAVLHAIETFKPDIIHVDHLNLSQYLPKIKNQAWILEHHNVESYLYWTRLVHARKMTRLIYLAIETLFTYRYERRTIKKFDHIFAISEHEKVRIQRMFGVGSVSTQPMAFVSPRVQPKRHKGSNILFIGVLDWPPNEDAVEWFIGDMFPFVLKQIPDAEFHIVGRLGQRYIPPSTSHIFVHGFQNDIAPFLAQADVFVLPFRMGGGLRLKALTALSAGLAVVTTPLGVEGLEVLNGKDCVITEGAIHFADEVVKLLRSRQLRSMVGKNALRYIQINHNKEQNNLFLDEYSRVIR